MPLTYKQYKILTIEVLIDRLIARNIFWLAFEICNYRKLTGATATNRVLIHWARTMVSKDASDDTIARTIITKLGDAQGISYAEMSVLLHS